MKRINRILALLFTIASVICCTQNITSESPAQSLPYLGFKDIDYVEINGEMVADTVYHTIGNFYFTAHTGEPISSETVAGKIYVADFFFTHCPTICPVMTENLKTLHQNTKDIEDLLFISHTIDPTRDTLARLNAYIEMHNIDTRDNWFFVRGSQSYTYDIGKDEYLINADVDREAEGGFLHSEHFVLIDREGHIRGMYEGTDPNTVKKLEQDIRLLISTEHDKSQTEN